MHVRFKEVLEGHLLKIYVVRIEGAKRRKVMGRENAQNGGGGI